MAALNIQKDFFLSNSYHRPPFKYSSRSGELSQKIIRQHNLIHKSPSSSSTLRNPRFYFFSKIQATEAWALSLSQRWFTLSQKTPFFSDSIAQHSKFLKFPPFLVISFRNKSIFCDRLLISTY